MAQPCSESRINLCYQKPCLPGVIKVFLPWQSGIAQELWQLNAAKLWLNPTFQEHRALQIDSHHQYSTCAYGTRFILTSTDNRALPAALSVWSLPVPTICDGFPPVPALRASRCFPLLREPAPDRSDQIGDTDCEGRTGRNINPAAAVVFGSRRWRSSKASAAPG